MDPKAFFHPRRLSAHFAWTESMGIREIDSSRDREYRIDRFRVGRIQLKTGDFKGFKFVFSAIYFAKVHALFSDEDFLVVKGEKSGGGQSV